MKKESFLSLKPKTLEREFDIGGETIKIIGKELDYDERLLALDIVSLDLPDDQREAVLLRQAEFANMGDDDDIKETELTPDQLELFNDYMKKWSESHKGLAVHILKGYTNIKVEEIPFLFKRIDGDKIIDLANDILNLGRLDDTVKK